MKNTLSKNGFPADKRLQRRCQLVISQLGYNPLDYGFTFQWIWCRKTLHLTKQLPDRKILLDVNSHYGKCWMSFYQDTYSERLFNFSRFLTIREFERVLKASELSKGRRGKCYHFVYGVRKFWGFI